MKKKKSDHLQKNHSGSWARKSALLNDCNWGGAFGVTKDGLPYIGEHPNFPGYMFVMGFWRKRQNVVRSGGRELTLDMLQGKTNEFLHYYRFDR